MAKKISIIIPQYAETPEQLTSVFSSLNNQVGVNWDEIECILVNDANPDAVPSDEWLKIWNNLNIRTIVMKENVGPGVARQVGIDSALGEYVMFIDADDVLHSVAVIGVFVDAINRTHSDLIYTSWLEEVQNSDGGMLYIPHEDEQTWMFGKCYNRRWLNNAEIRMRDDLRVHEDSYFNALAFNLCGAIEKIPVTSYVWQFNKKSTVRKNEGEYRFNSAVEFIKAHAYAFKILEEKIQYESMQTQVVQFFAYHWATLNQAAWAEQKKYGEAVEKALKKYTGKYAHYINEMSYEQVGAILTSEINKHLQNDIIDETWEQWLRRLRLVDNYCKNDIINKTK